VGTFCPEFDPLFNYILALGKLYVKKGFRVIYFLSGHYERSQIYMLKLISRRLVEYGREINKKITADVRMEPDFTIKQGISRNWKEDEAAENCKLPFYAGDHAGFYETGIALYLFPELVHEDKIQEKYNHPVVGNATEEWGKTWVEMILNKASVEIENALQGKDL
jgi:creatinine amidohydrolase/Fe(II)-dependent formamide hydrolase-like protein